MKFLQSLLAVVICATSGFGAVFTVTVTGSCPADLFAVQSALDGASPGDTISLSAGNFNFACDAGGVHVGTPDLAISGVPGQTILQGLGMTDPNESTGILIRADGVRVSGLTMTAFFQAVFVRGGRPE